MSVMLNRGPRLFADRNEAFFALLESLGRGKILLVAGVRVWDTCVII